MSSPRCSSRRSARSPSCHSSTPTRRRSTSSPTRLWASRSSWSRGSRCTRGEGAKRDGAVKFANTDPRMIAFYCAWLRRFFEIDEARLRVRLYLHEGLDLAASIAFWAALTSIPPSQFLKPYRAVPDPTIRRAKHVHGCVSIDYSCSATHRSIMGLVVALLGGDAVDPG